MRLHEIAYCRAGDKGTVATLTVVPHDDAGYDDLVAALTPDRVRAALDRWVGGEVIRHELPLVCCLQFVCTGVRGGGVTVSAELDTHGKSLSSRLLDLEIGVDHSDISRSIG
ncbi:MULTISPECIES: hypothetical protein [unclassified Pseudonocardia]|uniref:AtuA-related protein n=1 Tax=unclassified Pseudonocardia TaxID=2619320 RepID=UPI0001FFE76D|nr:hypothetical protein [Pseudonocardia sp. Ae707_Ps1]OLM18724.1 hypothetical protein Ae707Ps1_2983 [Pseudonocardia sp. Ae707_Ps1]